MGNNERFRPTGNETEQQLILGIELDLANSTTLNQRDIDAFNRLLSLARDGLIHRLLSKQVGGEPIAARWMRWAQEVAIPALNWVVKPGHNEPDDYTRLACAQHRANEAIEKAPKDE